MPSVEELLSQVEPFAETGDAHEQEIYCVIHPDSRTIEVPEQYQLLGVVGDRKVERLWFQCPKIVGDNKDISDGFVLFINYSNANGDPDAYRIKDMEIEGDNITFSWELEEKVTAYQGTVDFSFRAIKPEMDSENKWNTTINNDCNVLVGLQANEQITKSEPDALAQIWAAIDELKGGGAGTPGKDGVGIDRIEKTSTQGLVDTYTIYLTDESTYTFTVTNGDKGDKGDKGDTGATPNIQIGTVQTLEPGQQATASMSGTPENPLLNLGIPKGEKGDPGEDAESGESYTLPIMSDTQLGGGKAVEKTDEDVPVAVDPLTGQLFVPTYPENGSGGGITVKTMQNTDTAVTLQPNILYLFPEMATLDVTIPQTDQEIHFFFDSGAAATTFSLQAQGGGQIYTDAYSIDANMRYEVSVLYNVAYIKGVSMSET